MARTLIASPDLRARKGIVLGDKQRRRLEEQDPPRFPRRVYTSERTYGYVEDEIDQHVENCIAVRDAEVEKSRP